MVQSFRRPAWAHTAPRLNRQTPTRFAENRDSDDAAQNEMQGVLHQTTSV